MAGEKHQYPIMLFIVELDAPEVGIHARLGQLVEKDHLVASPASPMGNHELFPDSVVRVLFQTRHEIDPLLEQAHKPLIIRISPVKHQNGSWRERSEERRVGKECRSR